VAFSDTLENFRKSSGMSQYQFATACGVNHSYISRLERGMRNPTREMVQNFTRVLELNPTQAEYLFKQAGFVYNDEVTPIEDTARLTLIYGVPESCG
jgi:transcriptional regulator with XRE-family HTH domain